jgi:hypothetical protein
MGHFSRIGACVACGGPFTMRSPAARRCDECRKTYRWRGVVAPERGEARRIYEGALRDGTLVRQPCEKCGKSPAHGHHEDYSKPIEVVWLCPFHHVKRHEELGELRGRVPYNGRLNRRTAAAEAAV